MSAPKTWALVSNGVRARILRGLETGNQGEPMELIYRAKSTHLREVLSRKPGRSFASDRSGRRSAMEPGSDPILHDMRDFAREMLARLSTHFRDGKFEKLAILSPPRMLGMLRREMPTDLHRAVVLERAANLIQMPEKELRETVRGLIGKKDRR